MERITRGMLEREVTYLQKLGYTDLSLDHHQPGGNKYTWAVEDRTGAVRQGWSGRMTARECLILLCGMIHGLEMSTRIEVKR